ncbi:MAG: type 1 periplasmic binding fold superfamily protein [Bacteroidetes bacterium]|nr:MAG: type 1 periplasmic binding fold superfamily protein [Bacteroidota bacterium]
MKYFLKYAFLIALIAITIFSCKNRNEDPQPVEENELITTVELTFTRLDANGNVVSPQIPVVTIWEDLDGTGTGAPVVSPASIILFRNTRYRIGVRFLDKTKNPVKNVTDEVSGEGTKHQIFFIRNATDIFSAFAYGDTDSGGKPIGLIANITTNSTSTSGSLRIVLRHEPNKNAAGVSTGNITNAGGSTDVDTTPAFNINFVIAP